MTFTTSYGVSDVEVAEFVEANGLVKAWLSKFRCGPHDGWLSGSRLNKARVLCRFFKWLRVVKEITLSPGELLNLQLKKRQSDNVQDRQWLLNLVLFHTRDNCDFVDFADMTKYRIFTTVKSFCGYHEVVLTTAKAVYGKKRKKKNHRKQIDVNKGKKVLGGLSLRDRTICLIMWQSGMCIGEVLEKFSYMWHSQVKHQLESGVERLKIEFDERKGNGTWYYTYISRDAIHELRKWLEQREKIVEDLIMSGREIQQSVLDGEPIFITRYGTALTARQFVKQFNRLMGGKVTSHMFRKLFKSEASVPDRAIDSNIIKFFMGRAEATDRLDGAGGIYDRNPEIREGICEKEYAKLEIFINIYSSKVQVLHDDETEKLRREVADLRRQQERLNAFIQKRFGELEETK